MSTCLCAGIDEIRAAAQLRIARDRAAGRPIPTQVLVWAQPRPTGTCRYCDHDVELWKPCGHTRHITWVHPADGPECPGSCQPPKEVPHV